MFGDLSTEFPAAPILKSHWLRLPPHATGAGDGFEIIRLGLKRQLPEIGFQRMFHLDAV